MNLLFLKVIPGRQNRPGIGLTYLDHYDPNGTTLGSIILGGVADEATGVICTLTGKHAGVIPAQHRLMSAAVSDMAGETLHQVTARHDGAIGSGRHRSESHRGIFVPGGVI